MRRTHGSVTIPYRHLAAALALACLLLVGCTDGALRTDYRFADRIDVPTGIEEKERHELDLEEIWLFNLKPARMPSLVIEADVADAGSHPNAIFSSPCPPEKLFDYFGRTGGQSLLGPQGLRDPETNVIYNLFEYPSYEGREGRVLITSLSDKTLVLLHVLYYEPPEEHKGEDKSSRRKRRATPKFPSKPSF